jgi:hypothetical protein
MVVVGELFMILRQVLNQSNRNTRYRPISKLLQDMNNDYDLPLYSANLHVDMIK